MLSNAYKLWTAALCLVLTRFINMLLWPITERCNNSKTLLSRRNYVNHRAEIMKNKQIEHRKRDADVHT